MLGTMLSDMRKLTIFALAMFFFSCTSTANNEAANQDIVADSSNASADAKFEALLDEQWSWDLSKWPIYATMLGVRDFDDRIKNYSLEAFEQSAEDNKAYLAKFKSIDPSTLSPSNQLNLSLMIQQLEYGVQASAVDSKYLLLTNQSGPHIHLARMPSMLPFNTPADYQSYVSRLALIPQALKDAANTLNAGLASGWVNPCLSMQGFENSISAHIVDTKDSVFMQPFANKPAAMNQEKFDQLSEQAGQIVKNDVLPAYQAFYDFYTQVYAPECRNTVGTSALPGGSEYYEYLVRYFTTTSMSSEDVHQIGLSEVARIKAEMEEVKTEAGFEGSFEEWLHFLRTDEQFYFKTPQERLDAVAVIGKKMDGLLPQLFTKFPKAPWGIKEIPLDVAEKSTTAYYSPPFAPGTAGYYYVNTTKLDTRPIYELEALSLHEAVPGHHFQIGLATELDLPDFRKFSGFIAFSEGWGLYAERLGLDVGFYTTPYTNMGRLSYEMWRACRLVVDTGIHAKNWTRQEAIDYMVENSALSLNNITTEVDRYITNPGQAVAYKIGELKIRELRAYAQQELGEDFDLRYFHDKVLENGAIPLSVLEGIIKDWVKEQQAI